jgi:hypothetical protein
MKAVIQLARSAKLLWAAGALCATLLFGSDANASGPAIPALPNTEASRGFLAHPWTIADLDGDHHPDTAQSGEIGIGVHGYVYTVEFQLSGGLRYTSFAVSTASRLGLNIVPRDIDGDSDLDLVITTGALHQPVGVWLNDGKGAFTRADASLYLAQDGTQGLGFLETRRDQSPLLASNEGPRPTSIIPKTAALWHLKADVSRLQISAIAPASSDHAGEKQSRAPPHSLQS